MEKTTLANILRSKSSVLSFKEIILTAGEPKAPLLKRRLNYYVHTGELYSIRRGLYAKNKNYDRRELATKIFIPAYISFETILVEAGIIFQFYSTIFVATYQTKDIVCDSQSFSFKKIKGPILVNSAGVEDRGTYFAATKERAFLDLLYLNNDYYLDNPYPLDFKKVFEILPIYNNKRMEKKALAWFKKTQEE